MSIQKIILSLVLWLVLPCLLMAANPQKADALFQQGDYAEALVMYKTLHQASPKTVLYTYRLARCEQETGDNTNAIRHFEEAGDKYNLRNLYLGDLYYVSYRFSEAKTMYKAYLEGIGQDNERYEEIQEQLRRTERAERLLARIEDVAVTDSVSFPATQLLSHLPLSAEQGRFAMENGSFSYCNQRADRRFMTVTDPATGRILLCKQEKLLETWAEPDTLPDIVNRFVRQGYPFLMSDGVTLYYSAMSNQGLGEWDLYVTRYNPSTNSYLTPELIGMPFNSLANDYLYFVDEAAGKGYFVTDRQASKGVLTLYTFIPSEVKKMLQDSSDTYIRQFAQLQVLRPAVTAGKPHAPAVQVVPSVKPDNDTTAEVRMHILITDSVVYTSLDDFKSDKAREYAGEYMALCSEQEKLASQLAAQRLRYAEAEGLEKEQIKNDILLLEQQVREYLRHSKELLLMLRRTELTM